MKVRDVIDVLKAAGWLELRHAGSHRHFKHPARKGIVTVAGAPGTDVPIGTLRNIYRQAGLDWKGKPL